MNILTNLLKSSLGKKYIMAVTGLALFVFVMGHLLGNLQIFLGRDAVNTYAAFLKSVPELLWGARLGLLLMVGLHIWAAIQLTVENRAARPIAYADLRPSGASYASRTMIWSGLIIAAFIVYHLLHFTVGWVDPSFMEMKETLGDGTERHDVYGMLIAGFSKPLVSLFYMVAIGLLCVHLSHGVASLFQSLGIKGGAWAGWIDRGAVVAATIIFLGYISIPLSVLMGLVTN